MSTTLCGKRECQNAISDMVKPEASDAGRPDGSFGVYPGDLDRVVGCSALRSSWQNRDMYCILRTSVSEHNAAPYVKNV